MRLEARSRKSGARTRKLQRGLARGLFILASVLWLRAPAFSQTVTQISDTLKNADGTPASGRIVVTWDAFTQTGGVTVAAGSLSYTVTSGVIDLSLAYNSPGTGTVFNTAYRVDFYLANSSIYHELWAVPSSGPVALKDIVIGRSPGPPLTPVGMLLPQNGGIGIAPTLADAGKFVKVNPSGNGYTFAVVSGGGGGGLDPGGTGIVVETSPGLAANRSVVGTSNRITVTNGDGVAGNIAIDIGSTVELNTNKGAAGGYAPLDSGAKVPTANLPTLGNLLGSLVIGQTPLVTRGDLMIATGATPALGRLAIGAANTLLHGGTEPSYSGVADADLLNGYSGVGACAAHNWTSTLARNAAPSCTQPALADLSNGVTGTGRAVAESGPLFQSYLDVKEIAAPGNPSAGNDRVYLDSGTHLLTCLTSAGGSCLAAGGGGGVSSVGLSMPAQFGVTGTPITTSGAFSVTWNNQNANLVFAGPASGAAAAPGFRALVGADLPNPSSSTLGGIESAASVSNQWIDSISTSGVPHLSQPGFSNLSGSLASGQDYTTGVGAGTYTKVTVNTTGRVTTGAALVLGDLPVGTANQLYKTNAGATAIENATLSVGTAGSDFALAFGAGTITLNLPTASGSNRGALASADWTTFNGKIGGSGSANTIPLFTSSTALGNSQITQDGTTSQISIGKGLNVPVGTTSSATPAYDMATATFWEVTQTANISSSTTSHLKAGQFGLILHNQDATGGRTDTVPSGATNFCSPDPSPNVNTVQMFYVKSDAATLFGLSCTSDNTAAYLKTVTIPSNNPGSGYVYWGVNASGAAQAKLNSGATVTAITDATSAGGDLGGTYPNPTVTNGSHITNASIPNSGLVNASISIAGHSVALGGSQSIAFSDLTGSIALAQTPLTTLGDTLYVNATPALARLAGNTTTTRKFLTQTGDGTNSATPAWNTISASDLPNPSATTLGGVKSLTPSSHQFMTGISTAGTPSAAQPDFSDLTGSATASQVPAVTFTSGTSRTLAQHAEIIECTGACTVTPPGSATAGDQFCVRNGDNVSTIITLAAVSGVQYEVQAMTSYKTANTALASSGAVGDKIRMVASTSTKWDIFSVNGTWN